MTMAAVLPKCDYSQNVWVLENPTPGQRETGSTANWHIPLRNGTLLTSPINAQLLSELQAFVRSALEAPDEGVRMAPGSVNSCLKSLAELANFMVARELRSIGEITSNVSWDYVEYIEDEYEEVEGSVGRPRELTYASAYRLLLPLNQIYAQRREMQKAGVATMPEPPLSGKSTNEVVVNDMGLQSSGKLVPIPDNVAIPTLTRAFTYVTLGAPDVLKLQSEVLHCYQTLPYDDANLAARNLIEEFEFAVDPRTGVPWHKRIELDSRTMLDGREVDLSLIQAFRRLILELVAACATCIQGGTGIRAHELIGLMAGRSSKGLLPDCISSRTSSDGLMEMFFVKGITAKRGLAATEWLLGMRPVGTLALPAPAMAIDVLQDLLEPWRRLGERSSLMVTFRAARGLPRAKSSIGNFLACSLTNLQKEFAIDACVESGAMSEEEARREGRKIRAHRWRPTFAQFVFRTSPGLLISLRDHFKHISEVVTDEGYIGNDAKLLEDLQSERVQETTKTLLEMALGKRVGAGSVQHLIDRYREDLVQQIRAMAGEDDEQKALALVCQHDIRIWNGVYAACFMNLLPHKSKCNEIGGVPISVRDRPDYGTRSPGVCASCRCSGILPEHGEFWRQRLSENEALAAEERRLGSFGAEWSIAAKRAAQSRSILNALDRGGDRRVSVDPSGS